MREVEYDIVGGNGSSHPELEEIAAYLDGKLSAAERAGITEHLSVCTECLELFTETAHALQETSAGTAGGEVVPFLDALRHPRRWLPAAAAAAVLLALGVAGYRAFFVPPSMVVAELVEPLEESRGVAGAVWTGPIYRSGDQPETDAFKALSFLVGAHLVGFQAAVEAGDAKAASDAAQRVANYLEQAPFLADEVNRFRRAQRALTGDRPPAPSRFARLEEQNRKAIEDSLLEVHLAFGKWTQAGYIAARTGSREWFEQRANRRFLSYLLRQDEEEIEPEAKAALGRIKAVWDGGEVGRGDLGKLAKEFEAILDRYQALSEEEEEETFYGEKE